MKHLIPGPDKIVTFIYFCTVCKEDTPHEAFFEQYSFVCHSIRFYYHCSQCCIQYIHGITGYDLTTRFGTTDFKRPLPQGTSFCFLIYNLFMEKKEEENFEILEKGKSCFRNKKENIVLCFCGRCLEGQKTA